MLLRLASYAALGLLGLYAAEGAGLVPTRQYFPSLPRLEKTDNTAGNWQHGLSWGKEWLGCITNGGAINTCSGSAGYGAATSPLAVFQAQTANIQPSSGSFTHRISAKREAEKTL